MKIKRALYPTQLESKKMAIMAFDGPWLALVGQPERSGSWLIWGNSGNGKTSFALQLAGYLTRFGRVAYNSLEEGISESLKRSVKINGLVGIKNLILLDKEPLDELTERLERPKSPAIVIIDSIQYTGLNYRDYKNLRDSFRNKLFVFVSHAEGREPAGRTARSIRYDANVKIYIEGYVAYAVSRYGGGKPYVIWEQGADNYQSIALQKNKTL
ncbi:MAG: hypothetical protein PWR20_1239 [Bacteroidales bacterium]|nr:hypothetical protein [Bacteroidales bacterium]MDN5329361.1 hypothetical protein [Bacteroidales bacterium]